MKKVNLLILIAVLIAALTLSFAACNKDEPDVPSPENTASTTASPEETAAPDTTEAPSGEPSETEDLPSESPSGDASEQPTGEDNTEEAATGDPATGEVPGTATPSDSTATPAGKTPTSAPTSAPTEKPTETSTNQDPGGPLADIDFPASSTTYSKDFAVSVLKLNNGADKQGTKDILTTLGLTVKSSYQVHYDKAADDKSHTSSFTYGTGRVSYKGAYRNVVVVVIRSTMTAGEWRSNFDFAPSHNDNTQYAENFLACAQDVYNYVKPVIQGLNDPLVLITGFSRGAATANLLGTLYNKDFGTANGFIYTYATPNTIRNNSSVSAANIFNIINPADPVTMVPFKSLNYKRAGTDIVLADSQGLKAVTTSLISHLDDLASVGIKNMYETKYKLEGPGTDPVNGTTVFEFIDSISTSLGDMSQIDTTALYPVLSKVMSISPDSTLAPFRDFVIEALSMDSSKLNDIALQHKPVTYANLLSAS